MNRIICTCFPVLELGNKARTFPIMTSKSTVPCVQIGLWLCVRVLLELVMCSCGGVVFSFLFFSLFVLFFFFFVVVFPLLLLILLFQPFSLSRKFQRAYIDLCIY